MEGACLLSASRTALVRLELRHDPEADKCGTRRGDVVEGEVKAARDSAYDPTLYARETRQL